MDTHRATVFTQGTGTGLKCNRHVVGLEPQTMFPGDFADGRAQVIQVVVAFFELVLQRHGVILSWGFDFAGQHLALKPKKACKIRIETLSRPVFTAHADQAGADMARCGHQL
jgi:hypothetical protein